MKKNIWLMSLFSLSLTVQVIEGYNWEEEVMDATSLPAEPRRYPSAVAAVKQALSCYAVSTLVASARGCSFYQLWLRGLYDRIQHTDLNDSHFLIVTEIERLELLRKIRTKLNEIDFALSHQ